MWKVFQIYGVPETFNKGSVELTRASLPNFINPSVSGLVELLRFISLKETVLMKQPTLKNCIQFVYNCIQMSTYWWLCSSCVSEILFSAEKEV